MYFQCPNCNQAVANPPEYAGMVVACPYCGTHIQLPALVKPVLVQAVPVTPTSVQTPTVQINQGPPALPKDPLDFNNSSSKSRTTVPVRRSSSPIDGFIQWYKKLGKTGRYIVIGLSAWIGLATLGGVFSLLGIGSPGDREYVNTKSMKEDFDDVYFAGIIGPHLASMYVGVKDNNASAYIGNNLQLGMAYLYKVDQFNLQKVLFGQGRQGLTDSRISDVRTSFDGKTFILSYKVNVENGKNEITDMWVTSEKKYVLDKKDLRK